MFLLSVTIGYAQQDFGAQVKKKDVKKGLVSFEKVTEANGDVIYGFKIDGAWVGPNMNLKATGINSYVNYNKKHELDGTMINMNKQEGTITLFTYRKNKKNGPAFMMANGKVAWAKQFKNDQVDENGYQVNHDFDRYARNDNNFEGFTIEKYKNGSYALGYFAYGRRQFPMIHVWDDGDSYYGQYIQNFRKEFGVYFYTSGNKYVGSWDKNNQDGLGFFVNKDGEVTSKGYYEEGKLVIPL